MDKKDLAEEARQYVENFFSDNLNQEEINEEYFKVKEAIDLSSTGDLKRAEEKNLIRNIALGVLHIEIFDKLLVLNYSNGLIIKNATEAYGPSYVLGVDLDTPNSALTNKMFEQFQHSDIENWSKVQLIRQLPRLSEIINFEKLICIPDLYNQSNSNYNYLKRSDDFHMYLDYLMDFFSQDINEQTLGVIVVPDNFTYNKNYIADRMRLVENHLIYKIINLSRGFNNQIETPVSILVLKKNSEYPMHITLNEKMSFDDQTMIDKYLLSKENYTVIYPGMFDSEFTFIKSVLPNKNEGQTSKRLDECAEIFIGSQYTEKKYNIVKEHSLGACRFLKPSNIDEDGQFDPNDLDFTYIGRQYDRCARNFDVIITSKSSNVRIAVVEDLDEDEHVLVCNGMFIVRCKNDLLDPYYLKMYLETEKGYKLLLSLMRGDKIKVLTKESLQSLLIPSLSYDEQIKQCSLYCTKQQELRELKCRIKSIRRKIDITLGNDKTNQNIDSELNLTDEVVTLSEDEDHLLMWYYLASNELDCGSFELLWKVYHELYKFDSLKNTKDLDIRLQLYDYIYAHYKLVPSKDSNLLTRLAATNTWIQNRDYSHIPTPSLFNEETTRKEYIDFLTVFGLLNKNTYFTLASMNEGKPVFWLTPPADVKDKILVILLKDFKPKTKTLKVLYIGDRGVLAKLCYKGSDTSKLHLEISIDKDGNILEEKSNQILNGFDLHIPF